MGYKVGDKIKIKEWDDMEKEFGLNCSGNIKCKCVFTQKMKKYCGKTLEILKITLSGNYIVEGSCYHFSDDMIVKESKMEEWKMFIRTQEELNMVVDELIKQRIKWYSGRMVSASDEKFELPIYLYFWKEKHETASTLTYGHESFHFKNKDLLEITPQEFCKSHKETIVIYRDGNSVIAKDKVTGKKAVAKCHPDDEFDFMTGAKLALERLSQPEEEKPKYFNGMVVCIKSGTPLVTKGKIYEFKDGISKFNDGSIMLTPPIKSVEELNARLHSKFIEIVEEEEIAWV
mgnify:CR=1 FL=1